mgnify:CR=1 FL=1
MRSFLDQLTQLNLNPDNTIFASVQFVIFNIFDILDFFGRFGRIWTKLETLDLGIQKVAGGKLTVFTNSSITIESTRNSYCTVIPLKWLRPLRSLQALSLSMLISTLRKILKHPTQCKIEKKDTFKTEKRFHKPCLSGQKSDA